MASDIWLRTILIVRKETRCRHIGYSYRLTARVLLYAPSHRQDNTYHGLCYTSRGALAGTRNSSMGPPHEGSIRRPIAPWVNTLPLSYIPLLWLINSSILFNFRLKFINLLSVWKNQILYNKTHTHTHTQCFHNLWIYGGDFPCNKFVCSLDSEPISSYHKTEQCYTLNRGSRIPCFTCHTAIDLKIQWPFYKLH